MDLLLTHGYFLAEDAHERAVMKPYPPLGILYIASHLQAKGFDVAVFDTTFSTREAFRAYLEKERPPVVGISCNLMTRASVIDLVRTCKELGATVVLGGPEPVNYVEEYLARGADVVVAGEGELTLEELLPHLAAHGPAALQHIRAIAYREDGHVVRTAAREAIASLDGQPFPAREAIDLAAYVDAWRTHHGAGSVSLITARGCPYKCTWCSHSVFGYTHRRRSPGNVADELELIRERFRPEMVWYADDVFTIHHSWLRAFAAELGRRGLALPFETISREDRLDDEVIALLAAMGCRRLWVGAESGSQRVLDAMKRRTDARRVREVVRKLKAAGIATGMFIMLGFAGEEVADLEETVAMLKDADPDTFLTTVAYPIKGTPYYGEVAGRVKATRAWADGSDRDLAVLGRHSKRFYSFATRWMVGEVALHRARNGSSSPVAAAKAWANARAGRLGMALTRHEKQA